jgi:hypothetical protein
MYAVRNRVQLILVVGALMVVSLVAACGSSPKTSSSPGATSTTTTRTFGTKYGTFTPTSHSGSSDAVVPIQAEAKAGLVAATHTGSGHFAIEAIDAENHMTDLLVMTVGAYSGTTAFGWGSTKAAVNLKVTATGRWTVKISSISSAPALISPARGKGDAVYLWNGKATNWDIKSTGIGHFAVINQGTSSYDWLVNQVAGYDGYYGTVPVKPGPAVTMIMSDGGAWRITFS